MRVSMFTGGIFDTNCYFLEEHGILVDAPQDAAAWLVREGKKVRLLLLTHGHIDHVWDAARIQREHHCQVACHADCKPMITERDYFKKFGFHWEIEPVRPDLLLDETPAQVLGGVDWQILLVPGHCPGSLCFHQKSQHVVFGGDVLFAGGIGRWDLPGGDGPLLVSGIQKKVFALPDETRVFPGHGPATTVGIEKKTNPYLT
jgi:glyoxylase-like metal-dependent hydrolase (beta-lactamase superfamily II)